VIVNYYEILSDRANEYTAPMLASYDINIPWFVSRGYVVFRPDIKYKVGHAGRSALNAVVSGVQSILNYSWIDPRRIAINGHSWGGYETNYIVTHTSYSVRRYRALVCPICSVITPL